MLKSVYTIVLDRLDEKVLNEGDNRWYMLRNMYFVHNPIPFQGELEGLDHFYAVHLALELTWDYEHNYQWIPNTWWG